MPSLADALLHPESRRPDPEPLELNIHRVIALGTAAWVAALAIAGPLYLAGNAVWQAPAICTCGALLGVLWWLHERRRARRRVANSPAPEAPGD